MATIKAPYNFVPFNTEVVSPHWIELISHDIPFSDSVSGVIEFKLTAQTEIFVRDGIGQKKAQDNIIDDIQNQSHTFSKYQNKYFIPGSSIKGMVRNVLEILSFGGMADKVNNHRYALRDLSGAMKNTYLKDFKPDKIYCGWLKKEPDNSYKIIDCGFPGRIEHKEIDRLLGTSFVTFFSPNGHYKPKNNLDKSAQKKYAFCNGKNLKYHFVFEKDDIGRSVYIESKTDGNKEGTLVFTGQPGRRQQRNGKWEGHYLEFIFFNSDTKIDVPASVIENFFFAYFEHDKPKWSKDWEVWRVKLSKGEQIPVFFQKEDNGTVKSLGLSYLYKLPYTYSVVDSIKNYQAEGRDLSDVIFGHVQKNNALKGRVHIGHAFADTDRAVPAVEKKEVLSSPKASYYPTYIQQQVNKANQVKSYKTFMDSDAQIAGWKRYPVHYNGIKHNPGPADSQNDNIMTKFIPLQAGAEFKGTIHYHNLRKVELGALLSALTFHGTDNAYHNIGMAKPLGYGKVKLDITRFETTESDKPKISDYLCAFESYMNVQLNLTQPLWHKQVQVVELVTMAQDAENTELSYMSLKEHIDVKRGTEGLTKYSAVVNKTASIQSYCDIGQIERMKAEYESEKKIMEHTVNIEQVIIACRDSTERDIADKWEDMKQERLSALAQKRRQIEEREKEDKKKEEAAQRERKQNEAALRASTEGPNFNQDWNKREAETTLKKTIEDWGLTMYKKNNIQKVINEYPNGYLPGIYHEDLFKTLNTIYLNLNQNNKEKWILPFNRNAILKKVADWVGREKAENFFNSLK